MNEEKQKNEKQIKQSATDTLFQFAFVCYYPSSLLLR